VTTRDPGPVASSPGERRLEAPHRPGGARPRLIERAAVAAYRAAARLLSVLPAGPSSEVAGRVAQLSYLAWPTKRRWSDRNFGYVLGLPPDDPRVRSLALRAYHGYGRYLVDLMRLPSMRHAEIAGQVPALDLERVRAVWNDGPDSPGVILTAAHMAHNEMVVASIAEHGLPISVVGDDSSLPELFELLRRQRKEWGVTIIPWRNLREIFGVLHRREILGLVVDWGYRADDVPVRLFGAWTTLPAGPAILAARSGAPILPVSIHRRPDDTLHVDWSELITVTSSDPAEVQRVTQLVADALGANVGMAPEQWYSFKPMWPATAEEAADLERRARLMQAGTPDPGPA
jgi:KDO2-lipid IV(A) lauroyltransferase